MQSFILCFSWFRLALYRTEALQFQVHAVVFGTLPKLIRRTTICLSGQFFRCLAYALYATLAQHQSTPKLPLSKALAISDTMRRASFHRPKEKLRGIDRRLKAINKWANSFKGYFPSEHSKERYWNWKIPVLDRMVNEPTTTKELQAYCASAMLRAASYIEEAKPPEFSSAIVTTLLPLPNMFGSELCIFFDKEYYESFFVRNGESQTLTKLSSGSSGSLVKDLKLQLPNGFTEVGYHHVLKDEWEGEVSVHEESWWSYRGPNG